LLHAAVFEVQLRADDEVLDRAGDGTSPAPAKAATRADVDREPADVVVEYLAFAGVQSAADLQAEVGDAVDDLIGAARGPGRSVEGRDEPVPQGLDLPSTETVQAVADDRVVAVEELAPSPSRAARSVDATMPVNKTVASTRSASWRDRRPVRNSSTTSGIVGPGPVMDVGSAARNEAAPGDQGSNLAPGLERNQWVVLLMEHQGGHADSRQHARQDDAGVELHDLARHRRAHRGALEAIGRTPC
jgi:hypothetical protein